MLRRLLVIVVALFPFIQSAQCFPVKGKAVQADGKTPASGIVVQATHMREKIPEKKDAFVLKGRTEADGTFNIELPPLEDMYSVSLLDEQGHCFWGQAHINGSVDLGTVKLERGCELSGKIRTKDGKKLPGVEIQLKLKLKVCTHYVDAAKTTSGADGTFSFPDLSPGEYTYQSKGGAYAVKPGTINITEDPSYLELALEKAATIKGVVKDDQGKPVAGVRVAAENASVETDAAGKYVLGGMPIGSFYVHASGNGYVQKDDTTSDRQVKCEAGKEVERNFTVVKSCSLSLQVALADKNDQLPKQLTIEFDRKTGRNSSSSSSSAHDLQDGVALVKDLVPADYTVTVKKGSGTWLATNLTINAGQEAKMSVVLPQVFEIKGTVTDAGGKPVKGATIRTSVQKEKDAKAGRNAYAYERGNNQYLSADKDGKFTIDGLAEGAKLKISVNYESLMPTNRVVVVKKENPAVDFVLEKGMSISGSVLESDGKPAKDIEVNLSVRYDGRGNSSEIYEMMSSMSRSAKVDDKGGFELAGLMPGKYELKFYNKTGDQAQEEETSLSSVEAGTDDIIVTLGKKQIVTGRVTDKEGKPLAKVSIDVSKSEEGDRSYTRYSSRKETGRKTGTDGKFSFPLRGGTKYTISFSMYPYVQKSVAIDLGPKMPALEPISVELERGYKVSGSVVDDKGQPVKDVIVNASSQGNSLFGFAMFDGDDEEVYDGKPGRITDAQGKFSLDGVSPGIGSITASLKTNSTSRVLATKEILVSRDKPNVVKVALPKMGSIKGRVVNTEGKPLIEASVSLYSPKWYSPKGGISMSEQTDENGNFKMDNVPAGSYMAMWYDTRGDSSRNDMRPAKVVVKEGDVTEILLGGDQTNAKGKKVSGVVKKEGKPLGKGKIIFTPLPREDADPMEMATMYSSSAKGVIDNAGGFVVSNITAGSYCYQVMQEKDAGASDDDEEDGTGSNFKGKFVLQEGQTTAEINITGSTVTGNVAGPDGKPVSKCRVMITPSDAKTTLKWIFARHEATDAQGKFKVECVPPGKYDFSVNTATEGNTGLKNVEINGNQKPIDIQLGPAFKVCGKVTMSGSESPKGTTVIVVGDDMMSGGYAQVSDSGDYEVKPELTKGDYTIFIMRQGCAVDAAALKISEETRYDAKLGPGGHARVTVFKAGKPVKGQVVRMKNEKGEEVLRNRDIDASYGEQPWVVGPTDEEGKTVIRGVKPGKYIIYTDGSITTANVEVKALDTVEAKLKL